MVSSRRVNDRTWSTARHYDRWRKHFLCIYYTWKLYLQQHMSYSYVWLVSILLFLLWGLNIIQKPLTIYDFVTDSKNATLLKVLIKTHSDKTTEQYEWVLHTGKIQIQKVNRKLPFTPFVTSCWHNWFMDQRYQLQAHLTHWKSLSSHL